MKKWFCLDWSCEKSSSACSDKITKQIFDFWNLNITYLIKFFCFYHVYLKKWSSWIHLYHDMACMVCTCIWNINFVTSAKDYYPVPSSKPLLRLAKMIKYKYAYKHDIWACWGKTLKHVRYMYKLSIYNTVMTVLNFLFNISDFWNYVFGYILYSCVILITKHWF